MMIRIITSLLLLALCLSSSADEPANAGRRTRSLNFDDSAVVEGVNRNPMDSAESLEKMDRAHRAHLYNKRDNFRAEIFEHSQEAGYSQ